MSFPYDEERNKCKYCKDHVGDGAYDLSCPIHDKQNEIPPEQREKIIKRIIESAKHLKW